MKLGLDDLTRILIGLQFLTVVRSLAAILRVRDGYGMFLPANLVERHAVGGLIGAVLCFFACLAFAYGRISLALGISVAGLVAWLTWAVLYAGV
ncbi:MAG TPA: hypothetical protein VD929_06460 [Caulobacteraceae bacterium]|nr:hypothetical protein [Caulobacteraceae bacterium]